MHKCAQCLWFLILSISSVNIGAQNVSDGSVVAQRGTVKLTLQDIDLVLESVPAADRSAVVAGSDRLQHIIDSELLNKQMALRGRELKLMDSPITQRLVARAAEQELARITVERIVLDTKRPDFNLLAKEFYLANKAQFAILSQPGKGTVVRMSFPSALVLAG